MNVIFKQWQGKLGCVLVTTPHRDCVAIVPEDLYEVIPHLWNVELDLQVKISGAEVTINWKLFRNTYNDLISRATFQSKESSGTEGLWMPPEDNLWLDGSRYMGFYAREEGKFGSHAGYDDYDDESYA